MSDAETHTHVWRPVVHVDACHYFIWRYVCECGYIHETSDERDPTDYGEVWMLNDDGTPMCDRCAALLAGADRLPPLEITKPGGEA